MGIVLFGITGRFTVAFAQVVFTHRDLVDVD